MAHDSANEMSVDARTLLADIVSDGQLQRVVDIAERAANLIAGFSEKPGGMPLSEVLDWIERINADAVASLREDRPPDLALARRLRRAAARLRLRLPTHRHCGEWCSTRIGVTCSSA